MLAFVCFSTNTLLLVATVSSPSGSGSRTLYLPPDMILLQTEAAGLLGDKREEGLVCSAKVGLLLTAGRAQGSL
jgi:hypothetical protein